MSDSCRIHNYVAGEETILLWSFCLLDCRRPNLPNGSDAQKYQHTLSSSGPIQYSSRTLGFILQHNPGNIQKCCSKIHSYTKKLCTTYEYSVFVNCMVSNYSKGIYCQRIHRKEALITPTYWRAKLRERDKTHHWWGPGRLCMFLHSL